MTLAVGNDFDPSTLLTQQKNQKSLPSTVRGPAKSLFLRPLGMGKKLSKGDSMGEVNNSAVWRGGI